MTWIGHHGWWPHGMWVPRTFLSRGQLVLQGGKAESRVPGHCLISDMGQMDWPALASELGLMREPRCPSKEFFLPLKCWSSHC